MKNKDEYKIRRWLGDRYNLNTEITFKEDKTKIEKWKLFRVYPGWMEDNSGAIMTSETHTDDDLIKFAKKHRKYDLSMVDNTIFVIMSYLNFFTIILNVWIKNKYLAGFYWGINFLIIITSIVKLIFIEKNSKVTNLEFKERMDIFLKKENIKDERKNNIGKSN